MDASVSFESTRISLVADDAWFKQPQVRDAARWAEDNNLLSASSGGKRTVTLELDDWGTRGDGPGTDDPELLDTWYFEHESICKLFNITGERLTIYSDGYVGGKSLRVGLKVNGKAVDLAASSPPKFATSKGQPLLLSPLATAVASEIASFARSETHSKAEQLALIAKLKQLRAMPSRVTENSGRLSIDLDEHLESFEIVEPDRFTLRWEDDGRNRLSLKLYVAGEQAPLPLENLDDKAGIIQRSTRETIKLDPGTEAVARKAREYREVRRSRLSQELLHNPLALIPEGVETPKLDFSEYGHRVIGFEPAKRETAAFADRSSGTPWYWKDDDGKGRIYLTAETPVGSTVELAFDTIADASATVKSLEHAMSRGEPTVEVQGRELRTSPELAQNLRDLVRRCVAPEAPTSDVAASTADTSSDAPTQVAAQRMRAVLAPVDADDAREVDPIPDDIEAGVPWEVLASVLSPGVVLKKHQREGVAWLWHRYEGKASGALLADDMGLGKTLQIASFIALTKLTRTAERPKRPSLIVAPVVLLASWRQELGRFFQGAFPGRLLELSAQRLRGFRLPSGELDRTLLETHDIVIISYETLARYAMCLLAVSWDVVVLDEAHRIKNRGTQWSVAARGLSGLLNADRPRKFEFGICATGTPVENAVTDLWALYDFASPGSPFGDFEAFRSRYERQENAARLLAQELRVGSWSSSILRREKTDVLTDFPPKHYTTIPIAMTAFQRDQERTLSNRLTAKTRGSFKILESLQKLYQHPWLLDADDTPRDDLSHARAIAESPKLAECIRLLERIREKSEKVLIFTLWMRMQTLLRDVIEKHFDISSVPIINGDPKNRNRAQQHIEAFSNASGFGVMILSPLAAGVGLTITAANHVIHYGRWWNPAKEDQATDRVYRIGQSRPVNVYYPVLHHPGDPNGGFDMKLDELVSRKRNMARQLLEPADAHDVSNEDLEVLGLRGDA